MYSADHPGNYRNPLWHIHLTADLDIGTRGNVSYRGYSNLIPLFKELSMVFCAASKTYYGVEESQIAISCDTGWPSQHTIIITLG